MDDLYTKRDKLYYSHDPKEILTFYHTFNNVEELVQWLKNRPDADKSIYEIQGNTEIVFVVPTANAKGEHAKYINKIFHNYHRIFVESKGKYFNFAKSVNAGIKEAIKYDPVYIVVSNDDIIVNNPEELTKEILSKDNKEITAMIAGEGKYNLSLLRIHRIPLNLLSLFKKLKLDNFEDFYIIFSILKRFNSMYYLHMGNNPFRYELTKYILGEELVRINNLGDWGHFMIISSFYVKKKDNLLLDPNYINGVEDNDLLLEIVRNNGRIIRLKNKVKHIGGAS